MITKENKKPCIGIDVSKGESHFQEFKSPGNPISLPRKILHNKEGFELLLQRVKDLERETNNNAVIVFENTGTYSKPVEHFCIRNKITYYCIPPLLSAKLGNH